MVRSSPAGSRRQGQTADLPGFSPRARTDARACRVKGLLTSILVLTESEKKTSAAGQLAVFHLSLHPRVAGRAQPSSGRIPGPMTHI